MVGRSGRIATIAAVAALVLAACAPLPPPPASGEPSRPVIIVHGWQLFCGSEDATTWATWIDAAIDAGYDPAAVEVFSYETCQPTERSVAQLADRVERARARSGSDRVDIITHSMGSLIARQCIRFGGCTETVDRLVAVAGPNKGTLWAGVCALAFWSPATCAMAIGGPFLAELNAEDETWGDTRYVTMISWCDLTIVPFSSAALDGALNVVTDRCVGHTEWRSDEKAARWTFAWLNAPDDAARPAPNGID